jgi:HEAT repeat protein
MLNRSAYLSIMSFFGLFRPDPQKMETRGDVKGLIKAMGNTDDEIRLPAVQALCRIAGDQHVDLLRDKLNSKQWRPRAGAIEVLGCLNADPTLFLETLKDEHAEVRRKAAEALEKNSYQPADEVERVRILLGMGNWYDLGSLGEEAVEPLEDALKWGDPNVRSFVVMALSQIRSKGSVKVLSRVILEDYDSQVKLNAVLALKGVGPEAIEPLISVIGDPIWEIRNNAAETLAAIGEKAVEPLISRLTSKEEYTRSRASYALGLIRDPRAVEPLIGLLGDNKETVRWNAARALGQIKDPRALEALKATLEDEIRSVQWQATVALMAFKEGADVIMDAMQSKGNFCRQDLIAALGELGETRATELLISALSSEQKEVKWNSVVALGKIGDPNAVEPLTRLLGDRDPEIRGNILVALREIGDPASMGALKGALTDRDSKVRGLAVSTLAKIGDSSITRDLEGMLGDRNGGVRGEVIRALGALGDESTLPKLEELQSRMAPNQRYALERAIEDIKKRIAG